MVHALALEETIVVDDPDVPHVPAPAAIELPVLGRVSTAELTMQVHVRGEWHRRTPDLKETACGVPFHGEFSRTRREVLTLLDGDLCHACFTPHEMLRAMQADAEALAAAEAEQQRREEEAAKRAARALPVPKLKGDR